MSIYTGPFYFTCVMGLEKLANEELLKHAHVIQLFLRDIWSS